MQELVLITTRIAVEDDAEVPGELEWQERALCAQTDPEAFFPEKGGSTREAKRVCMSCEVRVQCLDYALENDERFGIWGGLRAERAFLPFELGRDLRVVLDGRPRRDEYELLHWRLLDPWPPREPPHGV